MSERKNFWDRNAGWYNRFMRKDRAAYEKIYALIRPEVKAKTVLELATGTGLIAKNIVNAAAHIEATDASAEMIAEAKRDNQSAKLHFSVQDMFRLPYADESFDVVIVSNALHIVPQPEKALAEIRRVLKDDGAHNPVYEGISRLLFPYNESRPHGELLFPCGGIPPDHTAASPRIVPR